MAELLALQAEYADWLAAMPEATRNGATGEALQAIVDLDVDELNNIEAAARLRTRLNRRSCSTAPLS